MHIWTVQQVFSNALRIEYVNRKKGVKLTVMHKKYLCKLGKRKILMDSFRKDEYYFYKREKV